MELLKGLAILSIAALNTAAPLMNPGASNVTRSEPIFVKLDPESSPASTSLASETILSQQIPTNEPQFLKPLQETPPKASAASNAKPSPESKEPAPEPALVAPKPSATLPIIIIPPLADAPPGATPAIFMPKPDRPSASPAGPPPSNGGSSTAALNPDLIPSFGVIPNTNRNARQPGSCDGFTGTEIVLIPCSCPPERSVFLARLGEAVSAGRFLDEPLFFSNDAADDSPATNRARASALLAVLQSLSGVKGVGCPAASAPNFLEMQRAGVRINGTFIARVGV